jgi:hypothetical protein
VIGFCRVCRCSYTTADEFEAHDKAHRHLLRRPVMSGTGRLDYWPDEPPRPA